MKKQICHKLLLLVSIMALSGCGFLDEEDSKTTNNVSYTNTLDQSLGGNQGDINDYFYNFENDVNAYFFRYNPNLMANYQSYSDYYSLFGEDPTRMSYKTFPNYLLSATKEDEEEFTRRYPIDSLTVIDSVVYDSIEMISTPFKNLELLQWNLDAEPSLQRYKLVSSDWIVADTTLFYNDTFNVTAYRAILNTPFIESGLVFVDSSEWTDTNYVFISDDQLRFSNAFQFIKKQLSNDSLVFRINTDCNDNGQWDVAESVLEDYNGNGVFEVLFEYSDNNNNGEYDSGDDAIQDYNNDGVISIAFEFVDRGNGIWDPPEPYFDLDSSGTYDLNEPYQDRNCNGKWDDHESFTDVDGSGSYSVGDDFTDSGNKMYDIEEEYTPKDINGDGEPDKMLYIIGDKPNNLIVDWADPDNPQVLMELGLGRGVTSRWGEQFESIIEEVDFTDVKQQYVEDVDSLVTLFTREKVGHVVNNVSSPDDYYITKSEWSKTTGGETERFYNYHIFHNPNHLNQISYPSYFLPVGFYFSPNEIENGFWSKKNLESQVLYYTSNGLLRDGEMIDTAYYDTTDIAIYLIEKSYEVESSSVTVPAGHRSSFDVPAKDTTFTEDECFKITMITTMTMIGSGVDFGQKTISWLVKNKGLAKSEIYIRWTEHPFDSDLTPNNNNLDSQNQAWVGLNRIELTSVDMQSENNAFRKITNPAKSIELRDIGDHPDFNFDSFYLSNQIGIQTLDLRELSE